MKSRQPKLGSPVFNRLLFVLNRSITEKNHLDYRFMSGKLREVAPQVWVMPAYLASGYGAFLVFTRIETGQTVVAVSEGRYRQTNHDFRLSRPLVTGRGLNRLFRHNRRRALRVAHFLNQISKAAEGSWRIVKN